MIRNEKPESLDLYMNRFVELLIIPFLFLIFWSIPVSAGVSQWTKLDPNAEPVEAVAIDPKTPATMYIGTKSGIYKSVNGGATWNFISDKLSSGYTYSIAIDPITPTNIYATVWNRGLYGSIDGGNTWRSYLPYQYLNIVTVDPTNPSTIYVGTWGDGSPGVYKSINRGGTWTVKNSGLPPKGGVNTITVDPGNPSTVYAGSGYSGIYKSNNGGDIWSHSNSITSPISIYELAIDPVSPSTIYAGTGRGVYKSIDSGENWKSINSGVTNLGQVFAIAINPTIPSTIYSSHYDGVYKSIDGGGSWNAMNSGPALEFVRGLAIKPIIPSTVYAAHGGYLSGLYIWTEPTPQQHSLTTYISGSGAINNIRQDSSPFSCSSPSTSCTALFYNGSSFALHATASELVDFVGWSGSECIKGDCTFTLNKDTTITATFTSQPLVQLVGSITQYLSLSSAYNDALNGSEIRSRGIAIHEDVMLNKEIIVRIKGGYSPDFTTMSAPTKIEGTLIIGKGVATVENIIIR